MPNVSLNMELDEELKNQMERIAKESHRTLAGQVRLVLDEYVKNYKKDN